MSYTALYRTWRPNTWEDVVNQKPVIRILQNALVENKVSHAYLFSGPRGTGKTTVARLLAKSVNCRRRNGSEPCNSCDICQAIVSGTSVDVMEIDAASNRGIDEIRSLRESIRYLPVMGGYKVYIIDEVHMLTQEAFNALLKTLEEPPGHVIFILATTAAHKIPVTIASRCQRLEFRRLSIEDIEGRLEKILGSQDAKWEQGALRLVARAAAGSMRDALSVLDLCITYGDGKVLEADVREVLGATSAEIMTRLFKAISEQDLKGILDVTKESSERGKDMGELCQEIGMFARDLLLLASGGNKADLGRTRHELENMLALSRTLPKQVLIKVLKATSSATAQMRNSDNPRLVLDVCLLSLFLEDKPAQADARVHIPGASIPRAKTPVQRQAEKAPAFERKQEQKTFKQTAKQPKGPIQRKQSKEPKEQVQAKLADTRVSGNLMETVTHSWDALLDELQKSRKIQARAYLLPAKPVKLINDKVLVLEYPEGYVTHMEQIVSNPHKQVVQKYLEKLTKHKFDLAVEVEKPTTDQNGKAGETNHNDLHPLVKGAITILNGKVTKVT